MFKCDKCGKDSRPGEKQFKVVIERTATTHPGKEIEKELKFCQVCKDALEVKVVLEVK